MRAKDRVVSVEIGKETRAYPLRILVWHEIVNDHIGNMDIVVTYCPLCGTAMVFNRDNKGKTRSFGVSGLLYNSDVLMYDRETESLWSQLMMQAISGPAAGEKLGWLPSQIVTWDAWKDKNPQGKILSTDTGHRRDYTRQPYAGYEKSSETYFPVKHQNTLHLHPKAWVAGALINEQPIAFHLKALPANQSIQYSVGANEVVAKYNPRTDTFTLNHAKSGAFIPVVHAYAFAWHAFYPDSIYWEPANHSPPPQ